MMSLEQLPPPTAPDPRPTAGSPPAPEPSDVGALHAAVLDWYADHARDLPWRAPDTDAWAVLVSEVMLQQTPVARVEPVWRSWMRQWPAPADLAAASGAEVLRAWDRLGYPRRALRLQECARRIVSHHGGTVPAGAEELRALPGIGAYTAAAVQAFAYGRRAAVLDTNVRRVLGRVLQRRALPPPSLTRGEEQVADRYLPSDPAQSVRWNVAVMELGALVCTARAPRCTSCPLVGRCAWVAAGRPSDEYAARRRGQSWHGSDRQARGQVLAVLREAGGPVDRAMLLAAATLAGGDPAQPERVLASLLADGLLEQSGAGFHLPLG